MLRVVAVSAGASDVAGYLAGGRGDHHADGPDITGEWGGTGAARLGLSGEVTRGAFEALCRNTHPGTGGPLTPRTDAGRRVGYDLTFNCPKSVSVLYGLTGDLAVLDAFRAAVSDTMAELELRAETRVRQGGRRDERGTGNLVYASFVHTTARPVDGHPDPHLHCHAFVLNATFDPVEGRWKAVDVGAVKASAPYFEAAFHARLAAALAALGFDIAPSHHRWEVAGVPHRVLRIFSRRTAQVERAAENSGWPRTRGGTGSGPRPGGPRARR